MFGTLLALLVVLLLLYFVYHRASKCQPGQSGLLCRTWNWFKSK